MQSKKTVDCGVTDSKKEIEDRNEVLCLSGDEEAEPEDEGIDPSAEEDMSKSDVSIDSSDEESARIDSSTLQTDQKASNISTSTTSNKDLPNNLLCNPKEINIDSRDRKDVERSSTSPFQQQHSPTAIPSGVQPVEKSSLAPSSSSSSSSPPSTSTTEAAAISSPPSAATKFPSVASGTMMSCTQSMSVTATTNIKAEHVWVPPTVVSTTPNDIPTNHHFPGSNGANPNPNPNPTHGNDSNSKFAVKNEKMDSPFSNHHKFREQAENSSRLESKLYERLSAPKLETTTTTDSRSHTHTAASLLEKHHHPPPPPPPPHHHHHHHHQQKQQQYQQQQSQQQHPSFLAEREFKKDTHDIKHSAMSLASQVEKSNSSNNNNREKEREREREREERHRQKMKEERNRKDREREERRERERREEKEAEKRRQEERRDQSRSAGGSSDITAAGASSSSSGRLESIPVSSATQGMTSDPMRRPPGTLSDAAAFSDYMRVLAAGHGQAFLPPSPAAYLPPMFSIRPQEARLAAPLMPPMGAYGSALAGLQRDSLLYQGATGLFPPGVGAATPFHPAAASLLQRPPTFHPATMLDYQRSLTTSSVHPLASAYPYLLSDLSGSTSASAVAAAATAGIKRSASEMEQAVMDFNAKRMRLDGRTPEFGAHWDYFAAAAAAAQRAQMSAVPCGLESASMEKANELLRKRYQDYGPQAAYLAALPEYARPMYHCACADHRDEDIRLWNVEDVCKFLMSLDGCAVYADHFREQRVDGRILALLTTDHLMKTLGMKLGPALLLSEAVAKKLHDISKMSNCEACRNTAMSQQMATVALPM